MSDLFQEPVLLAHTEAIQDVENDLKKLEEKKLSEGETFEGINKGGYEDTLTLVSTDYLNAILQKLEEIAERQAVHTQAVNQFGTMLDHIVQKVSGFGQAIAKGGIGGFMGMLGGKSDG